MSVEVTRLPSGLAVDHRPRCRIWNPPRSGSGSARAAATSAPTSTAFRICSSTWRSRAPSAARRGRSPRRSRRSAAISMPQPASSRPAISPACSRPTCRSRSTCWPTSCPSRPSIRKNCGASRTSSCRRSAPPKTRPTISSSTACRRRRFRSSRSAVRSSARRRRCARSPPAKLRSYLTRNYRAPDMIVAAAGAVEHDRIVAEAEARFASFAGPAGPEPEPATFSGGTRVETRDLEQVHIAMALHGVPVKRSATLQPAGLHQRARRRHVVAPVPGGARESAASATRSRPSTCPIAIPGCSASMPVPTRPMRRN